MIRTELLSIACWLGLAAGTLQAQEATPPPVTPEAATPWTVGPRTLPVPAGTSDVLQAALASIPQPDIAQHVQTTPKTVDQWIQLIAQADADGAKDALELAKHEHWSTTVTEDDKTLCGQPRLEGAVNLARVRRLRGLSADLSGHRDARSLLE